MKLMNMRSIIALSGLFSMANAIGAFRGGSNWCKNTEFGSLPILEKSKLATTETKLAAMDQMIEQYNTMVGEYPAYLRELIEGPSKQNLQKRWQGPIAGEVDLIDGWNNAFVYSLNPKGTRPPYELYSRGSVGN